MIEVNFLHLHQLHFGSLLKFKNDLSVEMFFVGKTLIHLRRMSIEKEEDKYFGK